MISSQILVSKKFWRALLAGLVVVTLAMRGLIPVGYMPNAIHSSDQPFAMTICSGVGPMVMHRDSAPDKNKNGQKFQDQAPCPFGVNALFAFNTDDPGFALSFIVFVILSVFSVLALARARHFGDVAPRAPPFFS